MSKNNYNYRIVIKKDNKYYPLFVFGYYSDGGFFIKDIITDEKSGYLVHKVLIPRG
jgi:hypothetical protein